MGGWSAQKEMPGTRESETRSRQGQQLPAETARGQRGGRRWLERDNRDSWMWAMLAGWVVRWGRETMATLGSLAPGS